MMGDKQLREYLDWLNAFWEERGLTRPNGEMLFSYRVKKPEYLQLRSLLALKLERLNGQPWAFESMSESACFVLYSAEWWRREYAGGPWRWTHILESIWPVFSLDPIERTYGVERGLKGWGLRVGDAGKKYLGAIVAQGGLPLQMVAQGDGSITRLLVRGLRQAQLYAWDSSRLESFFEVHEFELVQHLRDKGIYRLLSSVVQAVLALRQEYQLAGVSNPVDVLDRRQPNWRERFPIAVDHDSAESLLVGLVREAAREVKPVTTYPVIVTRLLHVRSDCETYDIGMDVEMPSHLTLNALATVCGMTAAAIPQSFSLEIVGKERVSLGEGRQLLGGNEPTVMLSGRSRRVLGSSALHEQMLILRGMGMDLHEPVSIPGAEELDPDQPWVFACKDVGAMLVGVGSVRVPEDRCLVSVKVGQELLPVNEASSVDRKGQLAGVSDNRWIYELSGAGKLLGEDGYFLIQTRQISDLNEQMVWRGRRAPYGAHPLPVYQGVPQLCRLTPEGAMINVPAHDIRWVAAVKNGGQIEQVKAHRGPVDAWLMQGEVRQRRFRMVLVSPDARIRFQSGDTAKQGAIEFHGWGLDSLAGPDSLANTVTVQNGNARLELAATERPPADVSVAVAWPQSALTQRLELPFPSNGGRFSGHDGNELAMGTTLSLRQLHGTRVQVFDRNPDSPKKYVMSMELKSTDRGTSRMCYEQAIAIDQQGMGELRLMELEASLLGLMSQSDNLDARLELKLTAGQASIGQLFLNRYDAELERQALELLIPEKALAGMPANELDGIRLKALPLLRSGSPEVELDQVKSSGVPVGRWSVAVLSAAKGPWLVYPAVESTLQLRPTFFSGFSIGPSQTPTGQLCALGAAMGVAEQSDRMDAIRDVVALMVADLDHPSWKLISRHYQLLSHLPLSTFDYWRVLSKDLNACLAVVLKLSSDVPSLMRRMRDELGVMWELMPREGLGSVLQRYMQSWAHQLKAEPTDPLVRTIVEPLFRIVGQANPVLGEMVDLVLFQAGFAMTERLTGMIGTMGAKPRTLLNQLWQGENSLLQRFLLRTHIEDRIWPHFDLARGLVESLQELAPDSVKQKLAEFGSELIWMPIVAQANAPTKNVKSDVANVPLLAGLMSQCVASAAWWKSGGRLAQIRQIRSFDPAWFETAFRTGALIALMLEQTRSSEPSRFRRATPH